MKLVDWLFIISIGSIWIMLFYNLLLSYFGYVKYSRIVQNKRKIDTNIKNVDNWPKVSILIPAHNEEKVIAKTVEAMLSLDYPEEKLEIIVINDNSNDSTGEILREYQKKTTKNLIIIDTKPPLGGKGKSNALNIGFGQSTGEYIVVYDADNTPNKMAIKYLVFTILSNDIYAAVVGKFRCINKNKSILTRFINIETLSFQWLAQGGRWYAFNLATIPGTNFILRRSIIEKIGGWDEKAIAEDTEISIRIYQMGYNICLMPIALTWEQEPETLKVWYKQRLRWVKGNLYVILKYLPQAFRQRSVKITMDIIYFFSTYFVFLTSVLVSDIIFILGLLDNIFGIEAFRISIIGNFNLIWLLAYIMFILQIAIVLSFEKGEGTIDNYLYVVAMYFTYCQLWIIVVVQGFYSRLKDKILKKEVKWYKTERF